MSIPVPIRLTCPCCGLQFEDEYADLVTISGGGFYADFRSGFAPAHCLSEMLLYSCDHCGYTNRNVLERFGEPLSEEFRRFVISSVKRLFRDRAPSQDAVPGEYSKFERYAVIQEHLGAGPFDLGEYHLRASWTSGSDRCRSIAFARFQEALRQSGPIAEIEAPLAAYLAGEMARKLGEGKESTRLFRKATTLVESRPELAILRQLLAKQSEAPMDTVVGQFENPVLDPLSYYHCLILLWSAVNLKTSAPQTSFQVFRRVYAIAGPALERYVSQQVPDLPFARSSKDPKSGISHTSVQTGLSSVFMEKPNDPTMWVDGALISFAKQSLAAMNELASEAESLEESARIVRMDRMVASRLQVLEKSKKQGKTNEQPRGIMVKQLRIGANAMIAVLCIIALSLGAAISTKLILSLWGQPVVVGRLFLSMAANIVLGYGITWALGRLSKAAKGLTGLLGGASGIALVIVVNGWRTGLTAVFVLTVLLMILVKVIPSGKKT